MRRQTNSLSHDEIESGSSFLITGTTGSVGASLLVEFLRRRPHDIGYCLLRGSSGEHAQRRLNSLIEQAAAVYGLGRSDTESVRKRAIAIKGNFSETGLGLTETGRAMLRDAGPLRVWHCASSVEDTDETRTEFIAHTNDVTERVLNLVLQFDVQIFNHVWAAHIACTSSDADELPRLSPRATTEQCKQSMRHSEKTVLDRCKQANIPVRTLRPTIAIADTAPTQDTGYADYLGWVLKVAALDQSSSRGLGEKLLQYVGSPDAVLDLVPIDALVTDMSESAGQGAS